MDLLRAVVVYFGVGLLGFVVGGVCIFVFRARGGPPLELWHSVDLESEFTTGLVSEIDDFDDYLALETVVPDALWERSGQSVHAKIREAIDAPTALYQRLPKSPT